MQIIIDYLIRSAYCLAKLAYHNLIVSCKVMGLLVLRSMNIHLMYTWILIGSMVNSCRPIVTFSITFHLVK